MKPTRDNMAGVLLGVDAAVRCYIMGSDTPSFVGRHYVRRRLRKGMPLLASWRIWVEEYVRVKSIHKEYEKPERSLESIMGCGSKDPIRTRLSSPDTELGSHISGSAIPKKTQEQIDYEVAVNTRLGNAAIAFGD